MMDAIGDAMGLDEVHVFDIIRFAYPIRAFAGFFA